MPHKDKEAGRVWRRKWREKNRDKLNAERRGNGKILGYMREYNSRPAVKERTQQTKRLKRYGVTPCQFRDRLAEQGGRCAVCGHGKPNCVRAWHTDHDHLTGKFRGVLCHHCNVLLGYAKENIAILSSAISYLEAHK